MTCVGPLRWHSRAMRAALAPVVIAVVLALAGCGGAAAPEPEGMDNGSLGDYFAEALGMSEYGRAQWDAEQELIAACMSDAGFEYIPQPFTDTSVVTVTTERTRESVAETGWGIIPTDLTPYEPEAPPTAPNDVYYESLSDSAQAEYEVALQGQVPDGASSEMAPEDMGCWGRAIAQQQQTSPWAIDGFESLQAEMQGRWEQILAQPVYVAALERWSICMGDVGYPGLTVLDDAMQLVENKFEEEFPGFTYRLDDPRLPELAAWEREVAVASYDCEVAADTGEAVAQAQTDWETAFVTDHEDELAALVEAVKAARG